MAPTTTTSAERGLEHEIVSFIRAFGLLQPDRTACGFPISTSEAHALTEIAGSDGLHQAELARRLRLDKSTVSRVVDQLEGRGWVRRERDDADGRARRLWPTLHGSEAAGKLTRSRREKLQRILEAIPEDRRDEVVRAVRTLVEALDAGA